MYSHPHANTNTEYVNPQANGCGKTTIIESLKYAVTGSLPPGNKSGQSFVHDPRSMGQTSSKASIKLRITGMNGTSMVIARSMEVTQKKTSASFKALDGTIRTVDADGNRITQSHKVSCFGRESSPSSARSEHTRLICLI